MSICIRFPMQIIQFGGLQADQLRGSGGADGPSGIESICVFSQPQASSIVAGLHASTKSSHRVRELGGTGSSLYSLYWPLVNESKCLAVPNRFLGSCTFIPEMKPMVLSDELLDHRNLRKKIRINRPETYLIICTAAWHSICR